MKLRNGTNIRLDEGTHERVRAIAKRYRLSKADIVRNALYAALPKWERDGVRLTAPAAPAAN